MQCIGQVQQCPTVRGIDYASTSGNKSVSRRRSATDGDARGPRADDLEPPSLQALGTAYGQLLLFATASLPSTSRKPPFDKPGIRGPQALSSSPTAGLRTKVLDFGGFDSNRILISRDGIPRPIRNFPDFMSQAILVGVVLVGRLGVLGGREAPPVAGPVNLRDAACVEASREIRQQKHVFLRNVNRNKEKTQRAKKRLQKRNNIKNMCSRARGGPAGRPAARWSRVNAASGAGAAKGVRTIPKTMI